MKKKELTQKQSLIAQIIEMYDSQGCKITVRIVQSMLESEKDVYLGYSNYEYSDNDNYRNGNICFS